jgi:hypothetical protein
MSVCCDCCPYTPTCEELAELDGLDDFGEEFDRQDWPDNDDVGDPE